MNDNEFTPIPGQNNVILVAPHGFMGKPKDDERTAEIAENIKKRLNCYAVINKTYRKSRGGEPGFDRDKKICNLNNTDHYETAAPDLYEGFVGSIVRYKNEIINRGQVPYIFHIHGASTSKFEKACKDIDATGAKNIQILIGSGRGVSDNDKEESLTALPDQVDSLIACLKQETFIAHSTKSIHYTAKQDYNLNQLFRKKLPDNTAISFQLEIRKNGLRDNQKNAIQTSWRLADAIGSFVGIVPMAKAVLVENETLPIDLEKVENAVQHIVETYQTAAVTAMVEVGKYLVENFFNNDFEAARNTRNVIGNESICQIHQKLNEKIGSPSKSWVYNAIKVCVDDHKFEKMDFHTYGKLPISHRVKLAYVPDDTVKKDLAQQSFDNDWTVKVLVQEIDNRKSKRGKKSSPSTTSAYKTLSSLLSKPEEFVENFEKSFKDDFDKLKEKQKKKLQEKAGKKIEELNIKIQELEKTKGVYNTIVQLDIF
jgi:hypothetical protein